MPNFAVGGDPGLNPPDFDTTNFLSSSKLKKKQVGESPTNYTKQTSLYEIFKYPALNSNNEALKEALQETNYGPSKDSLIPLVNNKSFLGIEVEVERVEDWEDFEHKVSPWWKCVEDGSLRNSGREFVSIPLRGENVYNALYILKRVLEDHSNYSFSERTSVHVHLNVRKFTVEQLMNFLITYLIVEQTLFSKVKSSGFIRDKNIFCVPVTESKYYLHMDEAFNSYYQGKYLETVDSLVNLWKKYTALNLLPIREQGTVEFRHLGGTLDISLIMNWINLILSIRNYVSKNSLDTTLLFVENLNTNSQYLAFLQTVFGDYYQCLLHPEIDNELANGVTIVKESIVWAKKHKVGYPPFEEVIKSSLWNHLTKSHGVSYKPKNKATIQEQKAGVEKLRELQTKQKQLKKLYTEAQSLTEQIAISGAYEKVLVQINELNSKGIFLDD